MSTERTNDLDEKEKQEKKCNLVPSRMGYNCTNTGQEQEMDLSIVISKKPISYHAARCKCTNRNQTCKNSEQSFYCTLIEIQ